MQYADPSKLRCYFFGNHYISPIQHGIQAAHVVTKLFKQYGRDNEGVAADVLYDWADVGVTKILLNGGYQSNLQAVYDCFDILCPFLDLPFAKFHEEEAALNGALTSVGVVVPQEVYEYADDIGLFNAEYGRFLDIKDGATALAHCKALKVKDPSDATVQSIVRGLLYAVLRTGRLA